MGKYLKLVNVGKFLVLNQYEQSIYWDQYWLLGQYGSYSVYNNLQYNLLRLFKHRQCWKSEIPWKCIAEIFRNKITRQRKPIKCFPQSKVYKKKTSKCYASSAFLYISKGCVLHASYICLFVWALIPVNLIHAWYGKMGCFTWFGFVEYFVISTVQHKVLDFCFQQFMSEWLRSKMVAYHMR